MPNWISPFEIINLNDNSAKIKIKANKLMVINVAPLKPYKEEPNTHLFKIQNALLRAINVLLKTTAVFLKIICKGYPKSQSHEH